jgi:hypothetical protein
MHGSVKKRKPPQDLWSDKDLNILFSGQAGCHYLRMRFRISEECV